MSEEVPEQIITVSSSEKWMDRPIKVQLSTQIGERLTSTQTFYLTEKEADALGKKLTTFAFVAKGRQDD